MTHVDPAGELEFVVTIERIPTSDMLYATRTLTGGRRLLYVVKDTAFEHKISLVKAFKAGDELCVRVNAEDPERVIHAAPADPPSHRVPAFAGKGYTNR